MARPQKMGLSYFSFDVDIFSDRKIKILMARYGSDGLTLYIYLLCQIYREGYYLIFDEDYVYIAASDLNMSYDKIGQISNFLLERSLFDDKLFKSDKVLTSAGIQRRYQMAVKSRATKTPIAVDERFWLLSKEETETFIKVSPIDDFSEKNNDNSKKNEDNSKKNPPKSKVKKSKVNESKVVVEIQARDGVFAVTEKQFEQLQQTYDIDVLKSLKRLAKRMEKPEYRKMKKDLVSYIDLWLKGDEDNGRCPKRKASSATYGSAYDLEAYEKIDPFADMEDE